MAKKKEQVSCPSRLGTVGGSAVLEGVMMKGKDTYAVAVRTESGQIRVAKGSYVSIRKKHKWMNIPLLRGCVSFVESMVLSIRTLNLSAAIYAGDEAASDGATTEEVKKAEETIEEKAEEKPEKSKGKDKGKKKKEEAFEGQRLMAVLSVVATVFALALSVVLFLLAPAAATDGITKLFLHFGITLRPILRNVIEGCIKLIIFLLYLALISLMPDIKRTFQYHGAEHKSIFCYENGGELSPENAKNFQRFHPRCGTSFLFVMIILGVLISSLPFVPWDSVPLRVLCKLALLPLVMGIGFEFLMLAGKHPNGITRILSAPGLWVQRLTTREPSEEQLEVAIVSLKCALPEEFGDAIPEGAVLIDEKTLQPIEDAQSESEGAESAEESAHDEP